MFRYQGNRLWKFCLLILPRNSTWRNMTLDGERCTNFWSKTMNKCSKTIWIICKTTLSFKVHWFPPSSISWSNLSFRSSAWQRTRKIRLNRSIIIRSVSSCYKSNSQIYLTTFLELVWFLIMTSLLHINLPRKASEVVASIRILQVSSLISAVR